MLVRNETFAVAPILPTNVRVIVNQLRKIMPRSETDWLPGSCNETLVFRVEHKRELAARVGRSKTDSLAADVNRSSAPLPV